MGAGTKIYVLESRRDCRQVYFTLAHSEKEARGLIVEHIKSEGHLFDPSDWEQGGYNLHTYGPGEVAQQDFE